MNVQGLKSFVKIFLNNNKIKSINKRFYTSDIDKKYIGFKKDTIQYLYLNPNVVAAVGALAFLLATTDLATYPVAAAAAYG